MEKYPLSLLHDPTKCITVYIKKHLEHWDYESPTHRYRLRTASMLNAQTLNTNMDSSVVQQLTYSDVSHRMVHFLPHRQETGIAQDLISTTKLSKILQKTRLQPASLGLISTKIPEWVAGVDVHTLLCSWHIYCIYLISTLHKFDTFFFFLSPAH